MPQPFLSLLVFLALNWALAQTQETLSEFNVTQGVEAATTRASLISLNVSGSADETEVNQAYKHFIAAPVAPPGSGTSRRLDEAGTCNPFLASETSSTSRNVPFCSITACPGDFISASMCTSGAYCSGDTLLRLAVRNEDGSYLGVATNDDLCGLCSGLTYTAPTDSTCRTYYIAQGCYRDTQCSGQVKYTISRPSPSVGASRTNTLTTNGYVYSTLADVSIDGYTETCQSNAISLPSNWEIAPDTAEVRNLIASHPWSTDVGVVSSGVGYRTLNFPPAGQSHGDSQSKFSNSGNFYWTGWCNYQIIIRQGLPPPPSPSPTLPPSPTPTRSPTPPQQLLLLSPTASPISTATQSPVSTQLTGVISGTLFSVSNTGNAKVNTQSISVPRVCSDTTVTISTCDNGGWFSGDTLIRLFAGGTEVGIDDDSCALNGGSKIVYYTSDSPCTDLSLSVGCFNDQSCSGRVTVTTVSGPPSPRLSSRGITSKSLEYSASDTNYGLQNVAVARFTQCGSTAITASTCNSYNGDTYLRLSNAAGEISRSDDAVGCGLGSSLTYQPSANAGCETYTLQAGCFGSGSCAGVVSYSYQPNEREFYLSRGADGKTLLNGGYLFLMQKEQRLGLSEIKVSRNQNRLTNLLPVLGSTDYPFHFGDYWGSNGVYCTDDNTNSVCSTDINNPWIMIDLTGRAWNNVELNNRVDCCTSDLGGTLLAVAIDPRGTQISSWAYLDATGSQVYTASFPLGSSGERITGSGGSNSALRQSPSSGSATGCSDGGNQCYHAPDWSISGLSNGFQAPGNPYSGFVGSGDVLTISQDFAVLGVSQQAGSVASRRLPAGVARNGVAAIVGTAVTAVLEQEMPSAMDLFQTAVGVAAPGAALAWGVADVVTGGGFSSFVDSFFGFFFRRQLTDGTPLEWQVTVTIAIGTTEVDASQQEAIANHLVSALRNATNDGVMSDLMPAVSQRLDISHDTATVTSIRTVGKFRTATMNSRQLQTQAHPMYSYVDLPASNTPAKKEEDDGSSTRGYLGFFAFLVLIGVCVAKFK